MKAQATHINGSAKSDPQFAIERTRGELFRYLSDPTDAEETDAPRRKRVTSDDRRDSGGRKSSHSIDWTSMLQTGVAAWWREHPLRAGTMLLKPGIEEVARHKPLQTVAIAAAVGAGLVLIRPWRLISISAVALSLYRSSNVAGMASSLLYSATQSLQRDTDENAH